MLRTARAIEAELRERLRVEFATTLPQFDVMAALARTRAGMTMTELSRFLMVSNGNVTGIIDRLVTEKLVLRKAPAERPPRYHRAVDAERRVAVCAHCEGARRLGRRAALGFR